MMKNKIMLSLFLGILLISLVSADTTLELPKNVITCEEGGAPTAPCTVAQIDTIDGTFLRGGALEGFGDPVVVVVNLSTDTLLSNADVVRADLNVTAWFSTSDGGDMSFCSASYSTDFGSTYTPFYDCSTSPFQSGTTLTHDLSAISIDDLNNVWIKFTYDGVGGVRAGYMDLDQLQLEIEYAPIVEAPVSSVEDTAIYQTFNSAGSGLAIFIQYMASALPILVIGLGLIGVFVAIGLAISKGLTNFKVN